MTVSILWSGPRSRSTAFFRSMLERGDLVALHEPLEGLHFIGPIRVVGTDFDSPESLIDWLLSDPVQPVFLKETVNQPVFDIVTANPRFLREIQHTFLIRRPEEIAASWYALEGDMRIQDTGIRSLWQLYSAIVDAGGAEPVVVDSDDLVTSPAATMRSYCTAVGLPFLDHALSWDAGVQTEWARTKRWHTEASASTDFAQPTRSDRHGLESHPAVLRFAEQHWPFYELLRSQRVHIDHGV